jgi:hypothetical protein
MKQYETLENDFWSRWSALTVDNGEKHDIHERKIPVHSEDVKLTLAIDACWLSLMNEAFDYWENTMRQRNQQGSSPAQNAFVRRKMMDAWIELELAQAVHDEALITSGIKKQECVRLARVWLVRCLKVFTIEVPLYLDVMATPWQAQAHVFLKDFFKLNTYNA